MAYHPFRHLGLKFIALAMATLLWLTVAGEHSVERSMRVPLEFRGMPLGLEIVGDPPTSVDVRLRGASSVLSRMEPQEIVAVLDLSGGRPGSRLFNLRTSEVRVPYGISVTQLVPGTIALELEKTGRRTVPVMPAIDGDPAPGFISGKAASDPATVDVLGPESHLRQLTGATTEPVNISGARERVRERVTVGVSDSSLRLAQQVEATVTVEVLPAPVEREVSGVLIRWRNLGTGLQARVQPSVVRASARGRRDVLDKLGAGSIDAFVDLAGLGPGRYNLRVQIDPSQNFGVTSIVPAVVDVTIK
jgi:YbbR domain-containing protein